MKLENNLKNDLVMSGKNRRGLILSPYKQIRKWWRYNWVGYAFLAPLVILMTTFTIIPVIVSLGTSFTNYNMLQLPKWVGFNNYKLLLMDDDVFLIALRNTFIFAAITGPIGYIMSFCMAWVINNLKFKKGFALAFYAPSITSSTAMSVVWMYFFSSDRYGFINNLLINLGIMTEPVLWNVNPRTILPVVIVISVWMSMGTGFLVFLAGLQNVPTEFYEAGKIDGIRNPFEEVWYITLPLLKPQLLFGAINSIVGSYAVFDVAVAVAGVPSPEYAAHTIVAHLYDYAFIRFQMGYASAIAMILFVLTFAQGRITMRLLRTVD